MSDDNEIPRRRATDDINWHAIRENWPVILTIIAGLAFAFRQEALIQKLQADKEAFSKIVNVNSVVEMKVWQNNIERDIDELRKYNYRERGPIEVVETKK